MSVAIDPVAHAPRPTHETSVGRARDADPAGPRLREIAALFELRGEEGCPRSGLPRAEHALQCAFLAERAGHGPALVAAALLHDVGALLGAAPAATAEVGADWLRARFEPAVAESVRLQPAAERYLDTIEPLAAPGRCGGDGVMDAADRRRFEALAGAPDAVALLRIRREARVRQLVVPPLRSYRHCIAAVARDPDGVHASG